MSTSEVLLPIESNSFTPDEPWTIQRPLNHWYSYQADYALEALGRGPGKLLVIGSPIFEALELEMKGWEVTYLDVRIPPLIKNHIHGDASTIELPDGEFDAVSSTCVLCHAGMGRYGDTVLEGGDTKVIRNIYRTLKKGSLAAITFGPVSAHPSQFALGRMQRVFSVESAKRLALLAGFKIVDLKIRDLDEDRWVEDFKEPGKLDRHYLSMTLRK